jgi:hypothetical protein
MLSYFERPLDFSAKCPQALAYEPRCTNIADFRRTNHPPEYEPPALHRQRGTATSDGRLLRGCMCGRWHWLGSTAHVPTD